MIRENEFPPRAVRFIPFRAARLFTTGAAEMNVTRESRVDLDRPIVVVLTGLDVMKIRGGPNEFNQ
jgi:hypothetical protein